MIRIPVPSFEQREADKRKMIRYICERACDGERTILADGEDGELWVELSVYWDGDECHLEWESNEPECVSLEDIYHYFRSPNMTHQEWWATFIVNGSYKIVPESMLIDPGFPFQFLRRGNVWIVRFNTGYEIEFGYFPHEEGFQDTNTLLALPEKLTESLNLMGKATYETVVESLGVAQEAEKIGVPTRLITMFTYQPKVEANRSTIAKMKGLIKTIEKQIEERADEDVTDLEHQKHQIATYLNIYRRRFSIDSTAKREAQRAVWGRMKRAWIEIAKEMPALAGFLREHILKHGTAWMYRPPSSPPQWMLR